MNDKRRQRRRQSLLTGTGVLLALLMFLGVAGAVAQAGNEVLLLDAEGPVTPAMASYLERGIEEAEIRDEAVVVQLDTPGGALDTTQEIVQLFRNARVPVIVYVAPAGAQAASAGSLITLAAHAAGMAPETVIGAASPVGGAGEDIGETSYRKVVEDLKASVRGLAERRGPEAVTLAEAMIEDARAVHANEALAAGVIDVVAADVPALLTDLDGHTVIVDAQPVTLHTSGAIVQPFQMSIIEQVLHALSNSLLISILLPLGVTAILIELKSPGGWVAGFTGVLSLGLALYGLGQLPVNWLGLVLVGLAFVLFLLEVKAPGIGALAFAGAGTLLAGLLILFNSPGLPEFTRISLTGALSVTGVTTAFFLFVVTKAVQAQWRQPATGKEGLIGRRGRVRKSLVPNPTGPLVFRGLVLVHGEIWSARAAEAIETDEEVVVTGVDDLTLEVARVKGQPL